MHPGCARLPSDPTILRAAGMVSLCFRGANEASEALASTPTARLRLRTGGSRSGGLQGRGAGVNGRWLRLMWLGRRTAANGMPPSLATFAKTWGARGAYNTGSPCALTPYRGTPVAPCMAPIWSPFLPALSSAPPWHANGHSPWPFESPRPATRVLPALACRAVTTCLAGIAIGG